MGSPVFVFRISWFFILLFVIANCAAAQPDSIYRLPAGTRMKLKMDTEINSKVSSVDDTFTARISQPVRNRESVVLPVGIVVEGRIIAASAADARGRNGRLELRFETLRFEDEIERPIFGELANPLGAANNNRATAWTIFGGSAIGGAIGAASGKGLNALLGAAIGGGVGTGIAFARKGKDVRLRTGEEFEIVLKREVLLPVRDI